MTPRPLSRNHNGDRSIAGMAPGRLEDVLPARSEVAELLALREDSIQEHEGGALDLEAAALSDADPAAELARLRTRRFIRGWERHFETADGGVLHAAVFEFATAKDAARSCEDQCHALVATGALRVGRLYALEVADTAAVVLLESVGHTELLVQLVGSAPSPALAADVVCTLAERARSRLAARASSRPSS